MTDLASVKLIAEPWDATAEGYQVGGFPAGWSEWNGKYRDDVRRYWRGEPGARPGLATRVAGSSDLYDTPGRGPTSSINFVTSHDGLTLADLVAYDTKHNEDNGEDNRDGESTTSATTMGSKGRQTIQPSRRAARDTTSHSTTLFATAVCDAQRGDELGRSQRGNNNEYCQRSERAGRRGYPHTVPTSTCVFVQRLSAWRRATPALQRDTFFSADHTDVTWTRTDGTR